MGKQAGSRLDTESLRQLALRTNQNAVLSGSISKGRLYTIYLRIETLSGDPRNAGATISRKFEAHDEKELFGAIASVSRWVSRNSFDNLRRWNELKV